MRPARLKKLKMFLGNSHRSSEQAGRVNTRACCPRTTRVKRSLGDAGLGGWNQRCSANARKGVLHYRA